MRHTKLSNLIDKIMKESEKYMKLHYSCGHDFSHILRVHKLSKIIGENEKNVDMLILETAALLHDLGRHFERKNPEINHADKSVEIARRILNKVGFPEEKIMQVLYAIEVHSFNKGIVPRSIEAKILQDADRVDISGAVGIAMTFAYGGSYEREIYDINDPMARKRMFDDKKYSLDHISNKLLRLPSNMHTTMGKRLAEKRKRFLKFYLEQFRKEIYHED